MSPRPVPVKAKLCLVVDGSAGMSRNTIDWDRALSALPQDTDVSVIFCGINEAETCPATDRAALAQWLKDRPYAGGCDPYPGLVKSLELLRDHENAVLLWVHAPLPVHFDSAQTLEQWALRRGDKNGSDMPKVLSLCTETGKDAALGPLEALPGFAPVPVFNGTQDTLQFTLRTLASEDVLREYSVAENGSTETRYGHVARLAVADAVNRLHAEKQNDAAAKMAAKCRLVTPASGAVVLETEKQYKDHGLNPGADPDSIPSVPEPSEWALIAVTLIALSALAWWRRKVRMSATGAQ